MREEDPARRLLLCSRSTAGRKLPRPATHPMGSDQEHRSTRCHRAQSEVPRIARDAAIHMGLDAGPPAPLMQLVVVGVFLCPLFLDLAVAPAPHIDRQQREESHAEVQDRIRADDGNPGCPDPLARPEFRFSV